MSIAVDKVMSELARRRPVFCSEADFQHELAHELRASDPGLSVRLEYPVGTATRQAIDILLMGNATYAIELKYLTMRLAAQVGNEAFNLRQHSAHDIRRYDVCKDVLRLEAYSNRTGHGAAAIILTNDPAYWQPRRRPNTADGAFDLADGRALAGELQWGANAGPGTTKGREAPLGLSGTYPLKWRDYSDLVRTGGRFRYLWVPVAEPR